MSRWIAVGMAALVTAATGAISPHSPTWDTGREESAAILKTMGHLDVTRTSRLRLIASSAKIPEFQGALQFLSPKLGFALAANGPSSPAHLLATTDGGTVWQLMKAPPGLSSMDMVSAQTGWITVCHTVGCQTPTVLEKTSDGGRIWRAVLLPPQGHGISGVDFVTPKVGWVEKSSPTDVPIGTPILYRTTNGGETWTREALPSNAFGFEPESIDFISPSIGWMLVAGQPSAGFQEKWLYRTDNGGQSWTEVASTASKSLPTGGYAASVTFADAQIGYLPLARGPLMRTTDGGRHWTIVTASPFDPEAQAPLIGLSFTNPKDGFTIVGSRLWHTTDGGTLWTPVYPPLKPTGIISFATEAHGVAVGFGGNFNALLYTHTGGRSWEPLGPPIIWQTAQMAYPDTVWGIGYNSTGGSTLLASHDGGNRFQPVSLPQGDTPVLLAMKTSTAGSVIAENNGQTKLLHTSNGGKSWNTATLPFSPDVFAGASRSDLWAAGMPTTNPVLYHSSDGGARWSIYQVPNAGANHGMPLGMAFIKTQFGYFWTPGAVFLTRNGGKTWQIETVPSGATIGCVDFISPSHGWLTTAVGLYQTVNGGRTWTQE